MIKSIDVTGRRCAYRWRANGMRWALFAGRGVVAKVVPDGMHARMWRIEMGDGALSDMVNLTRAMDTAIRIADGRAGERIQEVVE